MPLPLTRTTAGALLSAASLLAATSAAHAANQTTLDPHAVSAGHLLLDPPGMPAGSALVAWTTAPADDNDAAIPIVCRVAPGAGCTAPVRLHIPGAGPTDQIGSGEGANGVFPVAGPGSTVWVFGPRDAQGDVLRWTSTDGGATFGEATTIAGANPDGLVTPEDALTIGSSTLIAMTGSTTLGLGAFGTAAASAGSGFTFPSPGNAVADSAATLDAAGRPVIAYYNLGDGPTGGDSEVRTVRYTSNNHAPSDLAHAANWTSPQRVSTGVTPVLSGGPSGVFLVSEDTAPGGETPSLVQLRKDNGSGFGAPVATLSTDGANGLFEGGAAAQSPHGRLAVVWPGARTGDNLKVLRLFGSGDGGASFTESDVAVLGDGYASDRNAQLAVADDGSGEVTFRDAGGLQLANLMPIAPYAPAPDDGPPAPAPTPAPVAGPLAPPTLTYDPHHPQYLTTSTRVGNDVVTLHTPKGCVHSGTIVVRIDVAARKRKGHVVVKVGRVQFRLDGRVVKQVRRAPFSARLRVVVAPGSTHTISAKAFLRDHHGLGRTRTLHNRFTGCSTQL